MDFPQVSAPSGNGQQQNTAYPGNDFSQETEQRKRALAETRFDSTLNYLTNSPPCDIPEELVSSLNELMEDWTQGRILSFE